MAKLRHLRLLTPFGRRALGTSVTEPIVYELFQGAAAVIEITASTADILLNYVADYNGKYCTISSPHYNLQKCAYYRKLSNLTLVLQLLSGTVDMVTSDLIRKSSADLLSGPLPNDLEPEVVELLVKFTDDLLDELKEAFRLRLEAEIGVNSNIWQMINDIPGGLTPLPVEKRLAFITDYGKADVETLVRLNADDGDLIKYWNEIEVLTGERKKIIFLDAYKRFKFLKPNEFKHIRELHGKNGGHWIEYLDNGHFKEFPNGSPPTIKTVINGHILYENLYYINPNGPNIIDGINYSKKSKHYILNPDWDEQEAMEQVAYAYSRKVYIDKKDSDLKINGDIHRIKIENYQSAFYDETFVEIVKSTKAIDPVSGAEVDDHLSVLKIVKTKK